MCNSYGGTSLIAWQPGSEVKVEGTLSEHHSAAVRENDQQYL